MNKIAMNTPIVEMDGDEMTRVLWRWIKETLIEPHVALNTEYYDLGLENREKTADAVTVQAAEATRRLGVAVKCATITANAQRVQEYNLSNMWPSPNATIRAILDGTVFRAPVLVKGISPSLTNWKRPITIARHAYGDIYKGVEAKVPAGAKAELVITEASGKQTVLPVHDYASEGIVMAMHNVDASIRGFARSCFGYALSTGQDLWFGAKDTISKTYDHRFKDIFAETYEAEYRADFEAKGIRYDYRLIDDTVARMVRSEGGFVWACKNYDGDVMSDLLAMVYGSLSMMTSVLVSPDGTMEYEAAHGTVTQHYYRFKKGEETSTNPVATIFAWSGALKKRGQLDGNDALSAFAQKLEDATLATIESGVMTGDLISLYQGQAQRVNSRAFLDAIAQRL